MQFDAAQKKAIEHACSAPVSIVTGGAGTGKCLGKGTPLLMYDGNIKNVEDITVGDVLMSPDSSPTTVLSTTSGIDDLFKITPIKGDSFICNRAHILSVKYTKKLKRHLVSDKMHPFNISVDELLQWPKKKRQEIKAWRTGVEFAEIPVCLDPYFVGLWLGDGTTNHPYVSTTDYEVVEYMQRFADSMGIKCKKVTSVNHSCPVYRLTTGKISGSGKFNRNPVTALMRKIGILGNKHIPHIYKANSRNIRLKVLAGIIDSDGYVFQNGTGCEIVLKVKELAIDVVYLARSLGMAAYIKERKKRDQNGRGGTYCVIQISGDMSDIPTLIARKKFNPRKQIKSVLHTSISVTPIGVGQYYGFTIDNTNGLFMLGDFTVTHNTTIIRAITERLEAAGESVALAAFAGKAAARIREACQHPASTIHRMLGYNGKNYMTETLCDKSIIVDEASMIDAALLAEIITRKPRRLCLVGDPAQLPPVGRGQPFHDIINLRPDLVAELTTCYRATEAVFQAATAIRNGSRPPMQSTSDGEKWSVANTGDAKRTHAQIMQWLKDGAFDFEKDAILVARNGETPDEPCTVRGLNLAIAEYLSPRQEKQPFNVGDRVMNTKNIPNLDVWNGTTGTIHSIDQDGGIWIKTDIPIIDHKKTLIDSSPIYTDYVMFPKDKRKHLQLAYAMTVHKAQGSQYRNVLLACFNRDIFGLLDRSLLYTGVTRTKTACCVVGEVSAVWAAIEKVNHKKTIIQQLAEGEA